MADSAQHVTIDSSLAKVVGKPAPDTRTYRAEGDDDAYVRWWDALSRQFPRGLVSPGGACPYAGVSRAAVHKAMTQGRLTVFTFYPHRIQRGIFGSKIVRENPYVYIPVVELKAWRIELEERIGRARATGQSLERVRDGLRRELEGDKPDWTCSYLDRHPDGRAVGKGGR